MINLQEIKLLLDQGKKIDDNVWKQMIDEVDINGDGEISYSEFEKMMDQLIGKATNTTKEAWTTTIFLERSSLEAQIFIVFSHDEKSDKTTYLSSAYCSSSSSLLKINEEDYHYKE